MGAVDSLIAQHPALGLLEAPEATLLTLRERPIATMHDDCSGLLGRFGTPQSVMHTVGALLSIRPSGLLILSMGSEGAAFRLRDGRLSATLRTNSPIDQAQWIREYRQQRDPLESRRDRVDAHTTYVAETAHEALNEYSSRYATMVLIEGTLEWVGQELPRSESPSITSLLMEHARRADEILRIEATLGDLDQLVLPVSQPPRVLLRPVGADLRDFFDEPDEAAESEWTDARQVFRCCNELWTLRELAERCRLGTFRTLAAVNMLLERGHVALAHEAATARQAA